MHQNDNSTAPPGLYCTVCVCVCIVQQVNSVTSRQEELQHPTGGSASKRIILWSMIRGEKGDRVEFAMLSVHLIDRVSHHVSSGLPGLTMP